MTHQDSSLVLVISLSNTSRITIRTLQDKDLHHGVFIFFPIIHPSIHTPLLPSLYNTSELPVQDTQQTHHHSFTITYPKTKKITPINHANATPMPYHRRQTIRYDTVRYQPSPSSRRNGILSNAFHSYSKNKLYPWYFVLTSNQNHRLRI